MLNASAPATHIPERPGRKAKNKYAPTRAKGASTGTIRGRQTPRVEVDFGDFKEQTCPPLPDHLHTLLCNHAKTGPAASPAATGANPTPDATFAPEAILEAAEPFVYGCVAEGVPMNEIDRALRLPLGSVNGFVLSDAEKITRLCVALVEAADRFDREARKMLATMKGNPSAAGCRVVLASANSLRCTGEGWRRLSESLGRKVTVLEDHADTKRKALKAKRQAKAAADAAKADEARRRRIHDEAEATSPTAPPPREIIRPLGTPMTQDEFDWLCLYDNSRAVKLIAAEDVAGLTALADEVRARWLKKHEAAKAPPKVKPPN